MAKSKKFDKKPAFTLIAALFDCTYFIEGEFVHGYKIAYSEINDNAQTLGAYLTKCTPEFYEKYSKQVGELFPKRIAFDSNGRACSLYSYDVDEDEDEDEESKGD